VESTFDAISQRVSSVVGGDPSRTVDTTYAREVRAKLNADAASDAGVAYPGYLRTKIVAVVAAYARSIAAALDYPPGSTQAGVVRSSLVAWAEHAGLTEIGPELDDRQLGFLRSFDLDYGKRRLRFVIDGIGSMYTGLGEPGVPIRPALDAVKARCNAGIDTLDAAARYEVDADLRAAAGACFGTDVISEFLRSSRPEVRLLVAMQQDKIQHLVDRSQRFLDARLSNFADEVLGDLVHVMSDWDPQWREAVLVRYLGFPYWDVLLHSDLDDALATSRINLARLSPRDVHLLVPPGGGEKLHGTKLQNFYSSFSRASRENDYLWGRLDAAEFLVGEVLGRSHPSFAEWCRRAFVAILDEETAALPRSQSLLEALRTEAERSASAAS
jgi:hypothetical protein